MTYILGEIILGLFLTICAGWVIAICAYAWKHRKD